jgi:hypothetical protein
MRRPALFTLLALAALVTACATPTAYGPVQRVGGPGYAETQIEADRFRVSFATAAGGQQRAEDFALRRAAAVTIERGYDYFVVTQRFVEDFAGGGGRSSFSFGVGGASFGRRSASSVGVGVGVPLSGDSGAKVSLEVRLGRGQRPSDPNAYDARDVTRFGGPT